MSASAVDRPTDPPHAPPRNAEPPEPDVNDERHAIGRAWATLNGVRGVDSALEGCPLVATLFAAVALPYEGAEGEPPVMGVLNAIRDSVQAWAHSRSDSKHFALVPYTDLFLLVRRVDVARALVHVENVAQGGWR